MSDALSQTSSSLLDDESTVHLSNSWLEKLSSGPMNSIQIIFKAASSCTWGTVECRGGMNTCHSQNAGTRQERSLDLYLSNYVAITDKIPKQFGQENIPETRNSFYLFDLENPGSVVNIFDDEGNTGAANFLWDCVQTMMISPGSITLGVKVLLPKSHGYVAFSNFLERRTRRCELVQRTKSFLVPRQEINPANIMFLGITTLSEMLSSAIGAILAKEIPGKPLKLTMIMLEEELIDRLSLPWLMPNPIPIRRLAIVEGRRNYQSSRQLYESAKALGILIVVVDVPGHWLEDPQGPHGHLREGFIPLYGVVDNELPQKLVNALRSYGKEFHGLMTLNDPFLSIVARAAEIMGLPTSPFTAFKVASDKGSTREMENDGQTSLRVSGLHDLQQKMAHDSFTQLVYPLIVKPCQGWSSDCVAKVCTDEELFVAVDRASRRHKHSYSPSQDVIIEPYVPGPEVDANFVLWNGQILFFEISDGFPCAADMISSKSGDNFMEQYMVVPSKLPLDETDKVRASIHQTLVRLGFRSGVFHCEARVKDSSMEYTTSKHGLIDLLPCKNPPSREASSFLIEINARTSGGYWDLATEITYGVSFTTLQALSAVGDESRFKALATQFLYGPQAHCNLILITAERGGILSRVDSVQDIMAKDLDFTSHIAEAEIMFRVGQQVPGAQSPELIWMAQFLVVSTTSRRNALVVGEKIRSAFTYEFA